MDNSNEKIKKEQLSVLSDEVAKGNLVPYLVSDDTMSPFLVAGRDIVFFLALPSVVSRGDIILYLDKQKNFVLSRLYRVAPDGYYFIGDGQTFIDGPYPFKSCRAYVPRITRKGKSVDGGFVWQFYQNIWIAFAPFREKLIPFLRFKRKRKQK